MDTSLIERTIGALLPHPLTVPVVALVVIKPVGRPANAVAYPREPPNDPWSLPLEIMDVSGEMERRVGMREPMMGLKTMGDEERALTRGITFDRYDMMEKIMLN